ncbi:MAG TPA: hypothetical protein VN791_04000 [Acidimicrobiales bacterium]|nr:hypothetical protein [Acidimicrobiales bacterium]
MAPTDSRPRPQPHPLDPLTADELTLVPSGFFDANPALELRPRPMATGGGTGGLPDPGPGC